MHEMLPATAAQSKSYPDTRCRRAAVWRVWTAILVALSFALLVSTAATHHHASAAAAHDCVVCSAVADKVADVPPAPMLAEALAFQAYFLPSAVPPYVSWYAAPELLPPGCGPPVSV